MARRSSAAKSTHPAPTTTRFVCVHGHFYQPPRENPWLETVEMQESAAPYHDWDERITSECYAPNGASRIQNNQNKIIRIMNNYSRMSFNFGSTLLSWLADFAPRTYSMILDADTASMERYSGHGSAIAQVYSHIIMPLASERDARTQIRWGIADFEHRFGRTPEGMWLAETAVSRKVLDLMAQEGIRFTILAPHQCARIRPMPEASASSNGSGPEESPWIETQNATVDPTRPYLIKLDEGRSIAVFFYDGPASRAIAFEGLLNSGEDFAGRLLNIYRSDKAADEPQLAHVATDGESYGHHHRHGEMALSYAMHWVEDNHDVSLTNYGEFLERFPPRWEAEVVDDSSWSCAHGIERWRSNCGCNGGRPGWNQGWRGPLREALDLLRDSTTPLAEGLAKPLLKDLWAARDSYINVILNRSPEVVDRFLEKHATRKLSSEERITVLELLELERYTQLMYTSCGWFFDEISGIETVQIIAYAGRVLQLAAKLFGAPGQKLEESFLAILLRAHSNIAEIGNGAEVYRRFVIARKVDMEHVGAHYAISSMFRNYPSFGQLFCYDVQRHSYDLLTSGHGRLALGRASVRSRITEDSEEICFAVLHLGDQNLSAAVKRFLPSDRTGWDTFDKNARTAVRRADLPEVIRLIDRFFAGVPSGRSLPDGVQGGTLYSLTSLFADEQHRILTSILNQTLEQVESSLIRIYEEHATLLHFLGENNFAAPPALALTSTFAINASLRRALETDSFDPAEVTRLLRRAELDNVTLDFPLLSFTADKRMKRALIRLEETVESQNLAVLHEALAIAESLQALPMDINIWQAQNIWNDMLRRSNSQYWSREWRDLFLKLGTAMNIAVEELVTDESVRAF